MTIQRNIDNHFLDSNSISQFSHKAMNTVFELYIAGEEKNYSAQAAHEVFREIDIIENDLSRFIPGSDISKINSTAPHHAVLAGVHVFQSLKDCSKLFDITDGFFNVTLGKIIDKHKKDSPRENYEDHKEDDLSQFPLIINDTDFSITKTSDVIIDLGGYGKGYALDRTAELLKEWSVESFLISGGYSTVLAYDSKKCINGWPVSISDPAGDNEPVIFSVQNISLSGSGLKKGEHIIDPVNRKAPIRNAAWAACSSAAWSDAFSTAFMIMDADRVRKICSGFNIDALLAGNDEKDIAPEIFGKTFRSA